MSTRDLPPMEELAWGDSMCIICGHHYISRHFLANWFQIQLYLHLFSFLFPNKNFRTMWVRWIIKDKPMKKSSEHLQLEISEDGSTYLRQELLAWGWDPWSSMTKLIGLTKSLELVKHKQKGQFIFSEQVSQSIRPTRCFQVIQTRKYWAMGESRMMSSVFHWMNCSFSSPPFYWSCVFVLRLQRQYVSCPSHQRSSWFPSVFIKVRLGSRAPHSCGEMVHTPSVFLYANHSTAVYPSLASL